MRWIVLLADRVVGLPRGFWQRSEPLQAHLLRLLYPPRCALCDADLATSGFRSQLCDRCERAVAPLDWVACNQCGSPLREMEYPLRNCPQCRHLHLEFDAAVALSAYQGRLKEAVLRMKWRNGEPIAEAMGDLLCARRGDLIRELRPDVVAPVPLHWHRRWLRGTNSPDILAKRVASFLQVRCHSNLLKLTRSIPSQKGLGIKERRRNLAGAFRVAKGYDIKGARVLLVDDVLTTGATCDSAAKALKTAGAASVAVVVLARTIYQ